MFSDEFCRRFKKYPNCKHSSGVSFVKICIFFGQLVVDSRNNLCEVLQAVKQIGPLEAPIYRTVCMLYLIKNCWNILNKNIYRMVKVFLHHGHLFQELNNIHFYSKKKKTENVRDFRPKIV